MNDVSSEPLSADQLRVLLSRDERGMIPVPEGSSRTMEQVFKALGDLARRGYVVYENRTGHRAYWVTPKASPALGVA